MTTWTELRPCGSVCLLDLLMSLASFRHHTPAATCETLSESRIPCTCLGRGEESRCAGPLLEAVGLVKHYGQVEALRGADFTVFAGEVVALIGDNGAGKSTLVKLLSGAGRPDAGEIRSTARRGRSTTPVEAPAARHRDGLPGPRARPDLDGAANLYLGRELAASRPARPARCARQQGDAGRRPHGLRRARRRPAERLDRRRRPLRRPAPERGGGPLGGLGQPDRLPRRAHGGAGRAADRPGARRDPAHPRPRHRRRADQPQHAAGAGGRGPHRGPPAGPSGGPLQRLRTRPCSSWSAR